MKTKELKAMNTAELFEKLTELTKDLIKERAAASTGTTSKNPSKIRTHKRTIARIHHIIGAREDTST